MVGVKKKEGVEYFSHAWTVVVAITGNDSAGEVYRRMVGGASCMDSVLCTLTGNAYSIDSLLSTCFSQDVQCAGGRRDTATAEEEPVRSISINPPLSR